MAWLKWDVRGGEVRADMRPLFDSCVNHLVEVYNQSTVSERDSGNRWHYDVNFMAHLAGLLTSKPVSVILAIMAGYSPRTSWSVNYRKALESVVLGKFNFAVIAVRDAAKRSLETSKVDPKLVKGPKVSVFAENLGAFTVDNLPELSRACVDTWQLVAMGVPGLSYTAVHAGFFQLVHEVAAFKCGYLSHEVGKFQAVTWLTVRRINGYVDRFDMLEVLYDIMREYGSGVVGSTK
jgi:hypothetical protein